VAIFASYLAERIAPYEPVWNKPDQDASATYVMPWSMRGTIIVLVVLLPVFAAINTLGTSLDFKSPAMG